MKRILIFALFFAALLPGSSVLAQNKVQGGMVVRKLTYHQKEKKKVEPVKPGFQQSVTAAFMMGIDADCYRGDIDYIAGYRFNNCFYAGAGIGLNYDANGNWDYYSETSTGLYWAEPRNMFSVPVYAHIRTYMGKKRLQPFFAFSAGANIGFPSLTIDIFDSDGCYLCSETVDNVTYLFEPAFGLDVRLTSGTSIHLQLGLTIHGAPRMRFSDSTHAQIYQKAECDAVIKLGFTF